MFNRKTTWRAVAAVAIAAVIGASAVAVSAGAADQITVSRLNGNDRYSASVTAAEAGYPTGANVVFITNGLNFPDALSAGPAAAKLGGPLLLTLPTDLPASVQAEVTKLKPGKVIIVGGTDSVSTTVENQLKSAAPSAQLVRLAGADRYEAGRNVVSYAFTTAPAVLITTGANYPDALSASAAGGANGSPVVLVNGGATNLDQPTIDLLTKLKTKTAVIAGGTASVSTGIEADLGVRLGASNVTRLAGVDRYDLSQLVAENQFTDSESAYLATGSNFPDALYGSALAGAKKAPLFTNPTDCIPAQTMVDIRALGVKKLILVGGTASLSTSVETLTQCADSALRGSYLPRPTQPFLESAAGLGLGLQVAWQPNPTSQNVTSYDVTVTPADGSTATGCTITAKTVNVPASNTAANISGLCPGVAYTAAITAKNASGASSASNQSSPTVPLIASAPDAPLIVNAMPRDGFITVNWTAPAYNGGQPVTGYTLTATGGGNTATVNPAADAATATIPNLTTGTEYTLSLTASNATGASEASTAKATPVTAYKPSEPTSLAAAPDGNGGIKVSWAPPADNGGALVSSYTYTWQRVTQNDDGTTTIDPSSTPRSSSTTGYTATLTDFDSPTGLYHVSVTAKNQVGTGPAATQGPVSPTVQANAAARGLSTDAVNALESATGNALIWKTPAPAEASGLAVGNVIVASPGTLLPEGALRKVTQVTTADGRLIVTTSDAALSDAFNSLAVANTSTPASGLSAKSQSVTYNEPSFDPEVPGVRLLTANDASNTSSFSIGYDQKFSDGSISGAIGVKATLSAGIDVQTGAFGIPSGASANGSAKVDLSGSLKVSMTKDFKRKIAELTGGAITIPVGPVPVILVPKVPVYIVASASGSVKVELKSTFGGKLSWSSKNPNKLVTEDLSTAPTLTGLPGQDGGPSFEATAGFEVAPEVSIYNIAGPEISASLLSKATVNFAPPPGSPWLQIDLNFVMKAGLKLDLFGFVDVAVEAEIVNASLPGITINTPTNARYTITPASPSLDPGQTIQLAATRSDNQTATATWSIEGGASGDTISTSGLFKAGTVTGRTVTVRVNDASGATGSTTLAIGQPFEAPQNLSVAAGAPYTAALSWTAPTKTGGYVLNSYRIVTTPDTGVHTTSTTSFALNDLSVGNYQVSIYALNAGGGASPAANATFTIGAGGTLGTPPAAEGVPVDFTDLVQSGTTQGSGCADTAPGSPCFIVGQDSIPRATVETKVGAAQPTVAPMLLPADAVGVQSWLYGISCHGDVCVADGAYMVDSVNSQMFAAIYSGGKWSSVRLVPPAGIGRPTTSDPALDCAADGTCGIAVVYDSKRLVLFTSTGGSWNAAEVTSASDSPDIIGRSVQSVSCIPGGTCIGISGWVTSSTSGSVTDQFVFTSTGSTVTSVPTPTAPDARLRSKSWLAKVDCTSQAACVAVGNYRPGPSEQRQQALIARLDAGGWSATAATGPADQTPATNSNLGDVSCMSSGKCVAAGEYTTTDANRRSYTVAYSIVIDDSAETATPITPSGYLAATVFGVECSSSSCAVIQSATPDSATGQGWPPIVSTYESGRWRTAVGTIHYSVNMATNYSLSCSEGGRCVGLINRYQTNFWTTGFFTIKP